VLVAILVSVLPKNDNHRGKWGIELCSAKLQATLDESDFFCEGQHYFVKPSRVRSRWNQEYSEIGLYRSFEKFSDTRTVWRIAKHPMPPPKERKELMSHPPSR
jgi:hypothetical protein